MSDNWYYWLMTGSINILKEDLHTDSNLLPSFMYIQFTCPECGFITVVFKVMNWKVEKKEGNSINIFDENCKNVYCKILNWKTIDSCRN